MKTFNEDAPFTENPGEAYPFISGDFICDLLGNRIQYRCYAVDVVNAAVAKQFKEDIDVLVSKLN